MDAIATALPFLFVAAWIGGVCAWFFATANWALHLWNRAFKNGDRWSPQAKRAGSAGLAFVAFWLLALIAGGLAWLLQGLTRV